MSADLDALLKAHDEVVRVRREPGRQREIEETFTAWHDDPKRIARLLRWLILMDEAPADIPAFIESAQTWQRQWDELQVWSPDA